MKARNKELKRQQQAKRAGSRGHTKIEDLWRRMRGGHAEGVGEEKKCRGIGDGADEPGDGWIDRVSVRTVEGITRAKVRLVAVVITCVYIKFTI